MRERGEYTPIARVLLDGPDFQKLTPIARHVFLTLKISFGPSGIEVRYPDALHVELAHQTGLPVAKVTAALDELERAEWIERERNVVWIVEHLRYHPNMTDGLKNHRTGVRQHVGGLPRLAITRRFIEHYAPYFAEVPDLAEGYPEAPDSHSIAIAMPIESRSTNTNTKTNTRAASAAHAEEVFAVAWSERPRRAGSDPKDRARAAFMARVAEGVSPDVMLAGVRRYAAFCTATGKIGTEYVQQAGTFFGPGRHYENPWTPPASSRPNDSRPELDRARRLLAIVDRAQLRINGETPDGAWRDRFDRAVAAEGDEAETIAADLRATKPWTLSADTPTNILAHKVADLLTTNQRRVA